MDTPENRLSDYIDALNAEREPEKHRGTADTPELEKCLAAVRLVQFLERAGIARSRVPSEAGSSSIREHKKA